MNESGRRVLCLVTIHGIGFQQAPAGATPGYADALHERSGGGLDYAFGYVESHGSTVPSVAKDNVGPLRGLLLYSTTDGSRFRFAGFLGID